MTMDINKAARDAAAMAARSTDKTLQRSASRLLARLNAPSMSDILDKVPGVSAAEKAALIGVSRITVWYWVNGYNRPRNKAAKQIAKLTGFSIKEIRGRDVIS